MGVLPKLPIDMLAAQPPPLPYVGRTALHSQTKVVLFYFLASLGILILVRAEFLSY